MKIPRFSLRDLFWLTAVVALAVAWVVSMKREKALELENLSNLAKLKEMTAHRDEVRTSTGRRAGDTTCRDNSVT